MAVLDFIPDKLKPGKKKAAPKRKALPKLEIKRYQPPILPSNHPVPPRLLKKLKALAGRYRRVNLANRLTQLFTLGLMLVALQMFVDWLVILNVFWRALILIADIGLIYLFGRKHLWKLLRRPPSLEACALMVEKHWRHFRGRVIATVQFSRGRTSADSPELISAVQEQTDLATATMDFRKIVSAKPLKNRTWALIAVALAWAILFFMTTPGSIALLERVFLIPAKVPRKTEVICLSQDKVIPEGESVLIEAQAVGIVPSHGRVTLTDDSGKIREITIDLEKDSSDKFALKVDRISEGFSYMIRINDGISDTYSVKVIPRPNVIAVDCEQIYPKYTNLPNMKRSVGNLALLGGSTLNINATANSKVVKASIKLIGVDKTIPMKITDSEGKHLYGQIQIPNEGLTGFSLNLVNELGISSGDATQYHIDLIQDRPPTIDLTFPERLQELVTLKAKPTVAFIANDDYGLAKVQLCYRLVVDQDAAATDSNATPVAASPITTVDMDLGTKQNPQNLKARYVWDLAAVKPALVEGKTVEYWMHAEDCNTITGPGIADSEHHTLKIVSDLEKKAEIMNRLVERLSEIGQITQDQGKINSDLGEVIQGKPAEQQQNQKPPAPNPKPPAQK